MHACSFARVCDVGVQVVGVAAAIELGVVWSTDNPDRSPAWLVGHPPRPEQEGSGGQSWSSVVSLLLGLTTFSWSYVPAFLTIELSSAMARPQRDFPKSLLLSASLAVLLFLLVGVPVVHRWGWDVQDPLYLTPCWPAHRPASRAMQACILAANLVAYALDSVPLARYCQTRWLPGLRVDDWSVRAVLLYALCSLPSFGFGLLASVTVGNLLSLLGREAFSCTTYTCTHPASEPEPGLLPTTNGSGPAAGIAHAVVSSSAAAPVLLLQPS